MAISKFLQNGKTYIEEVAEYLEARGLTTQDISIFPYQMVDYGYLTRTNDEFKPYVPEGWAYQVRAPSGDYYEDRFLLRVCNRPQRVYRKQGRGDPTPVDLPKFLHVGPPKADMTHFTSTLNDITNSDIIMFHEKFTCAALSVKLLGIPSLALSGCYNWSQGGSIKPSVRRVIELAKDKATIYICFDGDITTNQNVMLAARQFKGWINGLRPDITVVFPQVPDGQSGWDDWLPLQKDPSRAWLDELQKQGLEITAAMPIGWLIETFGLAWRATKQGDVEIEHTSDNYLRLLTHPQWAAWGKNIDGTIVHEDTLQQMTLDTFLLEYEAWLQSNVFSGRGAAVRASMVLSATIRRLETHKISVPHLILAQLPEVTKDEAQRAATQAVTTGINVVGPMSIEDTSETLLRIARDLVGLWAVEADLSPQWILALVGPSGSGKSNFIERLLAVLTHRGCKWQPAEIPKDGSRADTTEYKRIMRDSLIAMLDEYEPDEAVARKLEREFFSLSTKRQDMMRDPYSRAPAPCTLRAGIVLTTVDNNHNFVRSAKGAGAERRFIVWEMKGVVMGPDGKMTSNRKLLEELSAPILRYGYQMWRDGVGGSANEFSMPTVSQYISESNVVDKIGQLMSRGAMDDLMQADWAVGRGKGAGKHKLDGKVYRFTTKMLALYLLGAAKPLTRYELKDLELLCLDLGAQRIEGVTKLGDGRPARGVLEVHDWPAFVQNLVSRFT